MNRIRETRPAPRYGLLWAFVRRMLLLYAAWAVCRVIFYLMNASIIGPVGLNELPHLLRGSLAFDTASILYVNAPFILLSLLPFRFRERKGYQRMLLWLYSTVNGIALAINLSDGIYFHYARKRFTADELSYLGNNDNTGTVVLKAMAENWYVVLLAVALIFGLVRCYRRIRFAPARREGRRYFLVNLGVLAAGVALTLGGIRGGFSRQTRPITLSNATLYTSSDRKANLILSNPFCLLRTLGNRSLSYTRFFDSETLDSLYSPYHDPKPDTTALGPRNIVIFVLESFSSEHSALLNPDLYPNGRGFTPFLDSLMREGYCFPNAFANGHKSIEALPSVLSSIPSYRTPFVLMPQALAETKALPALLADEGYSTSFFNGSGRGSMGFGAYATLAGVQRYYSREDYEKVCGTGDFDGYWGIWDEPFLQYEPHAVRNARTFLRVGLHAHFASPVRRARALRRHSAERKNESASGRRLYRHGAEEIYGNVVEGALVPPYDFRLRSRSRLVRDVRSENADPYGEYPDRLPDLHARRIGARPARGRGTADRSDADAARPARLR